MFKIGGVILQFVIGWSLLFIGGALYLAQIISSVDFKLAQKLGIQENPKETDPILQRSERYTAYWDLVTLGWLPLAGILMITDHGWWPVVSLIGGSIYLDAAGREAAKNVCFRHEGMKTGTNQQQRIFFASYIVMALIAAITISYSIDVLVSKL